MLRLLHFIKHTSTKVFSKKYLLFTNVAISGGLSGVGDIIEQQYEIFTKQQHAWDRERTGFMSIGGITVGIFCHNWYNVMDHFFPGRTLRIVLKKVLIDQIVASPIVILLFFSTIGVLKRSSRAEMLDEMRDKFIRLYTAEWIVWPPAQMVNFYWLPTRYRVLYDNTISLGYDIYTSYVVNDSSSS